jgi:3-oxoacyl-[acyl-carrier-protein] synthase-3
VGISAAVPRNRVLNSEFDLLSPADRARMIKATGIEERRVAPDGLCSSDLCFTAAQRLIAELGWSPKEIDGLIFVSQTPDYRLPATSVTLQQRLGCPKTTLALDINLGCSGYVYGLSNAAAMVSAMGLRKLVLLVGDLATRTNSQRDRTSGPLFGDAGTATAMVSDPQAPLIHFSLSSDGSGKDAIIIPGGGYRNPLRPEDLELRQIGEGVFRTAEHAVLDGGAIFNFTLREVPVSVREVLGQAGCLIESVDLFVFHQANLMMNEQIRRKLGIPAEKHPYSLRRFGNTSCATLPLTIVTEAAQMVSNGRIRIMLSGFGVGLSWGTLVVETDKLVCPRLLEV